MHLQKRVTGSSDIQPCHQLPLPNIAPAARHPILQIQARGRKWNFVYNQIYRWTDW